MEMMSPSLRTTAADGMPWTICSLTDAQMEPGNPPYPLNAGTPPSRRMSVSANSSSSSVDTPGCTRLPTSRSTLAEMRPASFMASISAGDFLMIMRLAPSLCLPVVSPNSIAFAIAVQTRKTKASRNGAGRGGQHAGGRRAWKPRMQGVGAESSAAAESMGSGRREQNARHALVRTGTGGARAGRRARGAAAQRARKSEAPRPCAPARRRPAEAGLTAGSGWDCQDAVPRHRLRRRRGRSSGSARRSGTLP